MAPASQQNRAGHSGEDCTLLTLWLWPGVRTGHRSCFLVPKHSTRAKLRCQPLFEFFHRPAAGLCPCPFTQFHPNRPAVQRVLHTFHMFFHINREKFHCIAEFSPLSFHTVRHASLRSLLYGYITLFTRPHLCTSRQNRAPGKPILSEGPQSGPGS